MSSKPATAKAKFKCTDQLGNVAYIHNDTGSFRCVLANGTPASMFYAVGNCDEVDFVHRLTQALDEPDRLLRIVQNAARGSRVEMVSYKAAPKVEPTAREMVKSVLASASKDVVYAAADGTTYTGKAMAAQIDAGSEVAGTFMKELVTAGLQAMQSRAEPTEEQASSPAMGR